MPFSELYDKQFISAITLGAAASSNGSQTQQTGSSLPKAAADALVSIVIDDDLSAPSMFTLELNNSGIGSDVPFPWSDDTKTFVPGQKLSISLGYAGQDAALNIIHGEITSIEPLFRSLPSSMIVRGHDLRHRLLRGRKTATHTNATDSDIALDIAKKAGIPASAEDSSIAHEYVLQRNQTDLAFLQDRGRRIGYELFMINDTLNFCPRPIDKKKALTLALGQDILEFAPRLTTMRQTSEVVVQGWDPKKKEAIIGSAGVGKEAATMDGTTSGPKATNGIFDAASLTVVDHPVATKAEADKIALGLYNKMALTYVIGDGLCYGRPDLMAGSLVEITGVGEKFSGLYYVTSAKHSWTTARGYRTRFTVQRNAT